MRLACIILLFFGVFAPVLSFSQVVDDNATTAEDTPVTFPVLGNDTDPDGIDPATLDLDPVAGSRQVSLAVAGGTFTADDIGNITFTPAAEFSGIATVQYIVLDGNGAPVDGTATVQVTVTAINDPPVAANDAGSGNEDSDVVVNVLSNDSDIDGTLNAASIDLNRNEAGIQSVRTVADGTFTVETAGNVRFSPIANYAGTVQIFYTVEDSGGAKSNEATIQISITAVNDAPVAQNDAATTDEGTPVNISILNNDSDVEGPLNASTVDLNLSLAGIQSSATVPGGTFSVSGGVVEFVPVANFNGVASISYTVSDNEGVVSNSATISVTVNSVNVPPSAADDAVTTNEDTSISINVLANDADPDGTLNTGSVDLDPGTAGIQTSFSATGGAFSVAGGVVQFVPSAEFSGTVSGSYRVSDNEGALSNTASITVTVTAVNDLPVAVNDAGATNEDTPVSVNVTNNDTDIDGTINVSSVDLDPGTAGIQTSVTVSSGIFTVSAGVVEYTPAPNFNGGASVNYTVQDNSSGTSNIATISISVAAVNDSPVAADDAASTAEETAVTINILSNDTDVDGPLNPSTIDLDPVTAGIQSTRVLPQGTFTVSGGVVQFAPAANFSGSVIISYTVNDNLGATSNAANVAVTVTSINDSPVAVNDVATTPEDTPVSINVLSNDSDADGSLNNTTIDFNPGVAGIQGSATVTGGTFSVSAGVVQFDPAPNYNGSAQVSYVVSDNDGAVSNAVTITVTVTPVNDPPVAANDQVSTTEDVTVSINVLTNDNDVDGSLNTGAVDLDPSTPGIQTSLTVTGGVFSASAGVVQFDPQPNFSGTVNITYTVSDNLGAISNAASIQVMVNPVNDAPVAVNDAVTTSEDTPVSVNVLTNDFDTDGTLNVNSVDLNTAVAGIQNSITVAAGIFSVASGVVQYTPAGNFFGAATISYTVNDNLDATSNIATIQVTVTAVNDAPVAVNDVSTTAEDMPVSLNVLLNDSDTDGSINTASVDLNPAVAGVQNTIAVTGGTFTVSSGVVEFIPAANFTGIVSVNYTVSDNEGAVSNSASIQITVNAVNDAPIAVNDVISTNEDTPVTINILSNDSDSDGTLNTSTVDLAPGVAGVQSTVSVTGGSFTFSSGALQFVPTANFSGTAAISYNVSDNTGAVSNNATVTVTVIAVNDPPVAANDAASTNEEVSVNISVLANDTDVDGTLNAATIDLNPSTTGVQVSATVTGGTFTVSGSVVQFVPSANFAGTATVNYTVNDNEGATSNTATITVTVNGVNDSPVAGNDVATTNEDTPVSINILSNDSDPDGTLNTSSVDLNPAVAGIQSTVTVTGGTFTAAAGVVQFTPTANFSGAVSISYTVNDDTGLTSNTATIQVTVTAINDAPVAVNDAATTNEDTPVSVNILANDSDPEGALDPASVDLNPALAGIQNTAANSAGTFNVSAGVLQYTPVANFNGTATITYTVNDIGGLVSGIATVTITVASVNDAPVAVAETLNTDEDTPASVNILANDSDPDGTIDLNSVDLNPALAGRQTTLAVPGGSFSVNAAGVLSYTPTLNYSGTFSIQYTVRDNEGLESAAASVTINVAPVNDAPVAQNDAAATDENVAIAINVLQNDSDDNGLNPSTVDLNPGTPGVQNSVSVTGGTFSANASGVVTFTPTANFNGNVTATYTVSDNGGAVSAPATISVTVNSVNTAPVAVNDVIETNEDEAVTILVLANDTDDSGLNPASVDLNTATGGIQSTITTPQGTFTANTAGAVLYTPAANFHGTVSISYTIRDNDGAISPVATISVTVKPVNDAPVAVNDSRTTNEDTPISFSIVANDTDVDGTINPAAADLNTAIAGRQTSLTLTEGTVTIDLTGVVTFTPALNFSGTASFQYVVADNEGLFSTAATVTINVVAVNDAPVAANDLASTPQTQAVVFNILSNDTDVDGTVNAASVDLDPATVAQEKTRDFAAGRFTVDNAGNVTFTPVASFSGTVSISYRVNDNAGTASNTATITVLVNFVNTAPVAVDDAVPTNEDTPVAVSVLANDTDNGSLNVLTVDLNPASPGVQNSFAATGGTFAANASGVVTFTPALNFSGQVAATYTVEDNLGASSNAATITITVTPVNDAPVAVNDNISVPEDTELVIKVLDNDSDVDGTLDPASVDLVPSTVTIDRTVNNASGTFTANPTSGEVVFQPTANFNGTVTITYSVADNSGARSASATIAITVINDNDPPAFDAIPAQRVLRNSVQRTITITSISPGAFETEPILLTAVSGNSALIPNPVVTYSGTGTTATLTFKPQLNQTGTAEITVEAVDTGLKKFSRTFTISVEDVLITTEPLTLAVAEELYDYNFETNALPETLTFVATQRPAWAVLTSTGQNKGRLSGTPPANATSSTVTIQIRDGATVLNEQQFVLRVNRRPNAVPFGITANEDVSVLLPSSEFVRVYSDPENQPIAEIRITRLPRHGSLLNGSVPVIADQVIPAASLGSLSYQPSANFTGKDTVYFSASDGLSFTRQPTYIYVEVVPVNDAPEILDLEEDPLVFDIGRELAQSFTTSVRVADEDGDNIMSAEVGFRRTNFNSLHDVLSFTPSAGITGRYDPDAGILTLSGSASAADYQSVLRSVTYNYIDLDDIDLQPRTVYITLNDGKSSGEARERVINLVYDFVELKIPEIFTPDGNGFNDTWNIYSETGLTQYNDAEITIYDKFGKRRYSFKGFETPWDGTINGVPFAPGMYFYTIDLKYGKKEYSGSVTILRNGQ